MELFERSDGPILRPSDVPPSRDWLQVRCVINPGAFVHRGRIGLLVRVCEQPLAEPGWIATAVRDPESPDGVRAIRFRLDDPKLEIDPRVFNYDGQAMLTTLSHLRLAWSEDGEHFRVDPKPALEGTGPYERFGIEDCRVTFLDDRFQLTFSAVSEFGVGVAHASTTDVIHFQRHGLILPPHNKDCALFPMKLSGREYAAVHRPSGAGVGGHFIWISTSPDLKNWGNHRCLLTTRRGGWDSARVGANGPPILTEHGWLLLYHGADENNRYCFGAVMLDRDDPSRVLARSQKPIMQPVTDYEKHGFFGEVVFSNGHILDGDRLTIYYGAADEYLGMARGSLREVMKSIGF